MTERVGIILQARMGSSRLPGKVMKLLAGRPMLWYIIERLKAARIADVLVVATSRLPADDVVHTFAGQMGVACYRGDEQDVLDRYYQAALAHDLAHIVRATADNPFVDAEELDRLVERHLSSKADYTFAFGSLPIGVGVECFTMDALARSWCNGRAPNHREHVNEYIQENPQEFHIEEHVSIAAKRSPGLRLTVDTPEDFARAELLYASASIDAPFISTQEAIQKCAMLFA